MNLKSDKQFPLGLDFFSFFVHELKAPLIRLKIHLDQFKKKNLSPKQKEFVSVYEKELKLLFQFIHDGLEMKELDSSAGLKKEWIRWNDFLHSVQKKLQSQVFRSSVQILTSQEDDLEVFIDPFWMNSALSNLLLNAVQHSPQKGCVWLKTKWTKDKHLLFSIEDEGSGIPGEFLGKVFEPFQSLRNKSVSLVEKGTGLGLYIAKDIVEKHGGQIIVHSHAKKQMGTVFSVHLPKARQIHCTQNQAG